MSESLKETVILIVISLTFILILAASSISVDQKMAEKSIECVRIGGSWSEKTRTCQVR